MPLNSAIVRRDLRIDVYIHFSRLLREVGIS